MSKDWKLEILGDFASWLVNLPADGEPPVAPPARRGLSDLFSAVSKLGREVALQNRAGKQAVVGLEATNAALSRMGTSLGAQKTALQALISESGPGRQSPRELAVGFLEVRDSLIRSHAMAAQAALRAANPVEDRVQPEPEAGTQPRTEPRARDDIHGRPPEDGPAPAEVRTQGDAEWESREDDSISEEPQAEADIPADSREERPAPAGPQAQDGFQCASQEDAPATEAAQAPGDVEGEPREDGSVPEESQAQADVPADSREERPAPTGSKAPDGIQCASQEDAPALAERPEPETEEIARHQEIVADIAGTLEVVLRKFDSILMSQGIAAVETIGRPFDAALMSVVGTRAVPGVPSGIVVEEVRGGFVMGRRVLRSAEVFVNRTDANGRGRE